MATVYGDEMTSIRAGRRVQPNVREGKLRLLKWTKTSLPAGNIGDVIVLGRLLKGDRVMGGQECHSALSSAGGTATGAIGIYAVLSDTELGAVTDVDRFLAATDMEAAGGNALAGTIALFHGWEADADYFVCLTNSVEAFATAGELRGYLIVSRD